MGRTAGSGTVAVHDIVLSGSTRADAAYRAFRDCRSLVMSVTRPGVLRAAEIPGRDTCRPSLCSFFNSLRAERSALDSELLEELAIR